MPILFSLLFLSCRKKLYLPLSWVLFALCAITSVSAVIYGPAKFEISGTAFNFFETLMQLMEILLLLYFYYISAKYKRWHVFALNIIQTLLTLYTFFFMEKSTSVYINVDKLSLLMLLIINIVGTLILIFANGYITKYEKHRKLKSRQKTFYPIICIFLSAMNGLVLSDSLNWVYFFWEITTLASFILISYNQDSEAFNSGFNALFLNMLGGISFSLGNILFKNLMDLDSFSQISQIGRVGAVYSIPVLLLCIAGFAKSAQLPFHSWLLGAMVAPTPVSALLHSSTMVKAGVYLIVKLSPAYAGTRLGTAIALLGGLSFFTCSLIAVSQRNAKRVLAYSTIANLGLIICSAGMGTTTAISAAMILIVFHSISKALLFLCTGEIEHTIGSRDIEAMTGLVHFAPLLTLITCFGIVSMILPPFGMLITKWISIEAAANNPLLAIFLVLGSALTTFFWSKWLGTLIAYPSTDLKSKLKTDFNIYFPLTVLSSLVLFTSIAISPIYNNFVSPEIFSLFDKNSELSVFLGIVTSGAGSFNDTAIFFALIIVIILAVFSSKLFGASVKVKDIYLCGENNSEENKVLFRNGFGNFEESNVSNFYFEKVFNEKTFSGLGSMIAVSLILIALLGGML